MKKIICGLMILSLSIISASCGSNISQKVDEIIDENKAIAVDEVNQAESIFIPLGNVVGVFQNDYNDEVELVLKEPEQMYITGTIITENGGMGELSDFIVVYQDDNMLVYNDYDNDYQLTINLLDDDTISIIENNPANIHGNDITFDGVWRK